MLFRYVTHPLEPCLVTQGGGGDGTEVVTCGARPLWGPGARPGPRLPQERKLCSFLLKYISLNPAFSLSTCEPVYQYLCWTWLLVLIVQ